MKTEIALSLALGLAAIQPASAQYAGSNPTGPYLGLALGAHYYDDDDAFEFDDGGSLGAQLGYRLNDNVRAELEAEATGADVDGTDDTLVIGRATFGLYYDFQSSDYVFVPYFGGAIGVAGVAIDDDRGEDEDLESELTWHGEAGISFNINPHFAIVPSYRYTWTDNGEGVTDNSVTSHAVRIGLRASF
jgi:opacity protein-like surface antigen